MPPTPPSTSPTPDLFISSDQRCGGTALNQIARILLEARCLDDPYSKQWKAREQPGLPCVLPPQGNPDACLQHIYRQWRCIKLCVTNWPADIYRPLLSAAIQRGCNIVLLYRQNALQRAMSLELARTTKVFDSYDWAGGQARRHGYTDKRVELDIERLSRSVDEYQQRTADVRALLSEHAPGYLEIAYEQLFGINQSMAAKFELLQTLCAHWGADPRVLRARSNKLERILSPTQKLNTPSHYQQMVRNLDSIDARFDADAHGDLHAVY